MISRPEAQRALIRAGASSSDDEAERFYALRVSDYARVLTMIFGALYVAGLVLALVFLPERLVSVHLHPAKLAHLATTIVSFVIWRLARRPDAPSWLVTGGDVFLPVAVPSVVGFVIATAVVWPGFYFVPLLFAAILLVLRAALVPSPPRRTAIVGALSSIPVVLAIRALASDDPNLPVPLNGNHVALGGGLVCIAIVAATVVVSRVIYGLHDEIRSVRRLGQYVLGELIGEGGMGSVYRAEHAMLRRPTAVKMLSPERA